MARRGKKSRRKTSRRKKAIRRPRTTAIKHFLNTSGLQKLGKATKKLANKTIAKIRSLKYV